MTVIDRYLRQERPLIDKAHQIVFDQEQSCPSVPPQADPDLYNRFLLVSRVFRRTLPWKITANNYEKLAQELEHTPTRNSELRSLAKSITTVAIEVAKLKDADIDLCASITEWKRMNWSKSYERKLLAAPFELFGIDEEAVNRAARNASATHVKLEELGLTFNEASRIIAVSFF